MIIRPVCILLFATALCLNANAQDPTDTPQPQRRSLPDLPGSFVLEFGFHRALEAPDDFDIGFWGSRVVNVYYQFDKRIGNTKFSVHPGFGFSFERFKFANDYTLTSTVSETEMVPASDDFPGVKKSMLVTNYINIPVEIRFSTRPDDPSRSFRVSLGGRVGYLYDSFTKIKYSQDGEVRSIKNKQNYNLHKLNYGAFFKIGVGNMGLITYYNLSPLFDAQEGPGQADISTFTVGLSLSSF